MLLRSLPPDALLWGALAEEQEKAKRPTLEQLRARQAHYNRTQEAP